jgi:hypothetical protein
MVGDVHARASHFFKTGRQPQDYDLDGDST